MYLGCESLDLDSILFSFRVPRLISVFRERQGEVEVLEAGFVRLFLEVQLPEMEIEIETKNDNQEMGDRKLSHYQKPGHKVIYFGTVAPTEFITPKGYTQSRYFISIINIHFINIHLIIFLNCNRLPVKNYKSLLKIFKIIKNM